MHTEYPLVDEGGYRHEIEAVSEISPELYGVAALAFVVKTVHFIDHVVLMVTPQQEHRFRILQLEGHQQTDHFDALLSTVYVVSDEQVRVVCRWKSAVVENAQKIEILTMDVTDYIHRLAGLDLDLQEHGLLLKKSLALLDQPLNCPFSEFDQSPELTGLDLNQLLDDHDDCELSLLFALRWQPLPIVFTIIEASDIKLLGELLLFIARNRMTIDCSLNQPV